MKKRLFNLSILSVLCFLLIIITGCKSIPKKVNPDKGLIIMNLSFNAKGYEYVDGKKTNVQITIKNTKTLKEYNAYTNADKFAVFELPADNFYRLTKVKYTGSSGESLWVDVTDWPMMKVEPEKIINLGYWVFNFDGTKNWCTWNRLDYYSTEKYFRENAEESAWIDMPIVKK